MNRSMLRLLAEERARDALGLLGIGQWSGAYYLTGYAVECGLKACIARKTVQGDFPDKELVIRNYTHDLESLIRSAGLDATLKNFALVNVAFKDNWQVVKDWNEAARYQLWPESKARRLYEETINPADGVLSWIKAYW